MVNPEYLSLIQSLVMIAALFHDWGKANLFFINKLSKGLIVGDPIRHEWLSVLLFTSFVKGLTDKEWLDLLKKGQIGEIRIKPVANPLSDLPAAASIVCWLILSHHRLPIVDRFRGKSSGDFQNLFKVITSEWGYINPQTPGSEKCFEFPKGLPCQSAVWVDHAQQAANDLYGNLDVLQDIIDKGLLRSVLLYARMSLMMADHYHSSQDADPNWPDTLGLYANTDRETGDLKHKLDEHLSGVALQGAYNARNLPGIIASNQAYCTVLDQPESTNPRFKWQDTAVRNIHSWRENQLLDPEYFGFFCVNFASTGTGKTIANSKIMQVLSPDMKSLRYNSALGLRTLTLQTGHEYRDRVGLSDTDMAVLIGSTDEKNPFYTDTPLLDNELVGGLSDKSLSTVLFDEKSRRFFHTPVLVCTIDHLMGATETRRGGRYLLPLLRLMSSDLVIDEIDDFDNTDLIAIGRLIHLAGLTGRKVLISSATISPDIAEGYYHAYQAGWIEFSKHKW